MEFFKIQHPCDGKQKEVQDSCDVKPPHALHTAAVGYPNLQKLEDTYSLLWWGIT